MKTRIVTITTCLLWNAMMCFSNDQFSSGLKSLNQSSVSIAGPNGKCAQATRVDDGRRLRLRDCADTPAQRFRFQSDGLIRTAFDGGRCIIVASFTQGSYVYTENCADIKKEAKTWQLQRHQVLHPSSGLYLTAISGADNTIVTLEQNIYSSYQTWQIDSQRKLAYIIGSNSLCLRVSSSYAVFLGECETTAKWYIYPDGTIRPGAIRNSVLASIILLIEELLSRAVDLNQLRNVGFALRKIRF